MQAFISRSSTLLCIAILTIAAAAYITALPLSNTDIKDFLIPWHQYIMTHGRWTAMGQEFANYTPPYLYVLASVTNISGIGTVSQIKIASWIGNVFLCSSCYFVFINFYDRRISIVASLFIAITPTAILNAAIWGQCDAFYTAALVISLGYAIRLKWPLALAAFGVALSFKLQAIFVAPAIGVFVIRRQIKIWMVAVILLSYYGMMLPAIIAGRTLRSVSLVYVQQFDTFKWLAPGAPNLWTLLQNVLRKLSLPEVPYDAGVIAGITLAFVASLAIMLVGRRGYMNSYRIITIFTSSAITIPFLLPKMHDRYLFAADIFSLIWMLCRPSFISIVIAMCVQLGSFLACLGTPFGYYIGSAYGSLPMSLALLLIWHASIREASSDLHIQGASRAGLAPPRR